VDDFTAMLLFVQCLFIYANGKALFIILEEVLHQN